MLEGKYVFAIIETSKDGDGNYVPVIVEEHKAGYREMDYEWGKDKKLAQECADDKNLKLGIGQAEAHTIIECSMFPNADREMLLIKNRELYIS